MGTVQRDLSRKKQQQQGVGVRVRELPAFLFSLLFSRSLPSRRTPLSERFEQANKNWVGREVRVNGKQLRRTTTRKAKSRKINTWKTKARKTFKGSKL